MKENRLFIGEDFSFLAEVLFNQEQSDSCSIEQYQIDIELSTTPLGAKIVASTEKGVDSQVEIFYREAHAFGFNVPASLTGTLSAGVATLGVMLTHRESGIRSIIEQRIFTLVESRVGRKKSIKTLKQ